MASFYLKSDRAKQYNILSLESKQTIEVLQLLLNKSNLKTFWLSLILLVFFIIAFLAGIFYFSITEFLIPARDYISINGLELKFILNLLLVLPLFWIMPCFWLGYFSILLYKLFHPDNCLIAICDREIIGFVSLFKLANKNTLSKLFVKEGYLQQGVGSNLVREISKTTPKPIYVNSLPEHISFYTRLGFKIREYKFPRKWLNKGGLDKQLILNSDCLSDFSMNTDINRESNQNKYSLYKADLQDIKKIVNFLGNLTSIPQDSFLPFGFSYLIPLQVPLFYVLVVEIIACIGVVFNNILDLPDSISLLILILCFSLFTIGLLFVKPFMYYVTKKYISQFWLVTKDERLIGYVRFKNHRTYSVVNHLSCLSSYGTEVIEQLINCLVHQKKQIIYVACDRKLAKIYYKHNFVKIKPEKLPVELRLGGKICSFFGGINLAHY